MYFIYILGNCYTKFRLLLVGKKKMMADTFLNSHESVIYNHNYHRSQSFKNVSEELIICQAYKTVLISWHDNCVVTEPFHNFIKPAASGWLGTC